MGYAVSLEKFQTVFDSWRKKYDIYAPKVFEGTGRFSETDVVRYGKVADLADIDWNERSEYSFKDILLPLSQTLLYFTEHGMTESEGPTRGTIVFLRSCDLHAVKRLDYMFLENGPEDSYYKRVRDGLKFVLMGCDHDFDGCFCVSMGTNVSTDYAAAVNVRSGGFEIDCKDEDLAEALRAMGAAEVDVTPDAVMENSLTVKVPENLTSAVAKNSIWDEYDKRCIKCGRCTVACPTCTCWSMQDLFYTENGQAGERRRVQASCMIDGYTEVAGGLCFRKKAGERMRFKVLHKVLDFKKRSGFQMCVGCGRCDAICPEYISFTHCVEKLEAGMKEVSGHE